MDAMDELYNVLHALWRILDTDKEDLRGEQLGEPYS